MTCHDNCENMHLSYARAPYVDPDYLSNLTDANIPLLSTIGRGPRGAGIKIRVVRGQNGEYKLSFVNDITNETIVTTPNLDFGTLEFSCPEHNKVDGEVGHMYVRWVRGAEVKSWDILIPPGAHGARIFVSENEYKARGDKTYQTTVDDLMIYNRYNYTDKPTPRPNDIIVCSMNDNGVINLCFGTIQSVDNGKVVFTSRTIIKTPIPSIGPNGHWFVDGKDTGTTAQGPKGDKGDKGDTGKTGLQGKQGERGLQGYPGKNGIDGKNATIEIGDVTIVPSGIGPSVTATLDKKTNITTLNFGIPEGPEGRAINVQSGIWYIDTLPPYNDTPVNYAYIVYDGDRQFDLYIRGPLPVTADDGGPWTVVEDWQGRPGPGLRALIPPYIMDDEEGSILSVPAADAKQAFKPSDLIGDGDIVIDVEGHIGVIGSSEDNSGTYEVTNVGQLYLSVNTIEWENVTNKPFSSVDIEGILNIEDDVLSADVSWNDVSDKPFESLDDSLVKNKDGSLGIDNEWLNDKVETIIDESDQEASSVDWSKVTNRPFDTLGDYFVNKEGQLDINVQAIGESKVRTLIEEITNA